jgi:type I restriction enzyme M protein
MRIEDLAEFTECYNPKNRHKRKPTWDEEKNSDGRRRSYSYDQLIERDKTSLDLFWLKDSSLSDLDNLPSRTTSPRKSSRISNPASTASGRSWLD